MKDNHDRDDPDREKIGDYVSIYRRNKTWWVMYQLDGKQQRESLKTSNVKEARRCGQKIEFQLQENTLQAKPSNITISDAIAEYLDHLETLDRSARTKTKYRQVLGRAALIADELDLKYLHQINLRFIDAYRKARRKIGKFSTKTAFTEVMIIRQLVNHAVSRELLNKDPLKGLKNPKPKPTEQPCWTPDQVENILAAANETQKSIFTLLADTGMRFGEAQWLTWDDVDFKRNVLLIRPKKGWKPKSGESRTVPMTARLRKVLLALPRTHRWVVTSSPSKDYPEGDHQISERRLLRSLKRLLKRIGLPTDGKLHTFRHSFVTKARVKGMSHVVLKKIVGHVSDEMLNLYSHPHESDAQNAMRLFEEEGTEPEIDTDLDDESKDEEGQNAA
jgi:Site-specific recombinase XerD